MKTFFTFFVLLMSCLNAWSQGKLKTQCQFGIKLGVGLHTITGCPVKTKPGVAFMGGMWVQIRISKNWTMQSELNRIDKGTGGDHQYQPKYGDYWLQLSYFEVPILFQYHKKNGYFEFGPALAALINYGDYSKAGVLPFQTDLYPFSNKDFSFNIGTGYVFNEKWQVGLRLIHSLLPVRKQIQGTSLPGYNRGIVLAVSRQIHFKASKNKPLQDID